MTTQASLSKLTCSPARRGLAILAALSAWAVATIEAVKHGVGQLTPSVAQALLSHPQAFLEYISEGFGGSLLFAIIHIALASFFKSQRNARTRWNTLLGWSVLTGILALVRL